MSNRVNDPISGTTANGVPFLAIQATTVDAPVVVAWHLLDAPRTETAFAAALPLAGLKAHKIYLGLPLNGARMPAGGADEIQRLGMEDAVLNLHWPIFEGAVTEFPAAYEEVRKQLGVVDNVPLGLLGGSIGSAIAADVIASGVLQVAAAVLVSPMLQLRAMVDELSEEFGFEYHWGSEADHAAQRMDFVARAGEIVNVGTEVLVIAGADDSLGSTAPARDFAVATGAELQIVAGVGHALADEPGIAAAPQTTGAHKFDVLAAGWFRKHLN